MTTCKEVDEKSRPPSNKYIDNKDLPHCQTIESGCGPETTAKPRELEGGELPTSSPSSCWKPTTTPKLENVDDNDHRHPNMKCREKLEPTTIKRDEDKHDPRTHILKPCGVKTIKEMKTLEGEESPPHINSNRRESTINRKDKNPCPSQSKKTMWADRLTWWRSGWTPSIQGSVSPALQHSMFWMNGNQKRWQWNHHRHPHNRKGKKERQEDVPHIKNNAHWLDKHIAVKAATLAIVKQPLKEQDNGLCHACIKIIEDLARKQGQGEKNGRRYIVTHHMNWKWRQSHKKQAPLKRGLQEASCK